MNIYSDKNTEIVVILWESETNRTRVMPIIKKKNLLYFSFLLIFVD